jgi:hypothetical protein
MTALVFPLLTAVSAVAIIIVKKKTGAANVVDTIVACMMACVVGAGSLYAFIGHAFMPDLVAQKIGWPAGSPFQFEVAVANLAFGVLGFLTLRFGDDYRLATATGYAVFLLGAAAGHVREIVQKGNFSDYNAGVFLVVGDILIPIALFVLVIAHRRLQRR